MERGEPERERARVLNDEMRCGGPAIGGPNRWLLTAGVVGLGVQRVAEAVERVKSFDAFNPDDDPCGERDFGSFELFGERLFWKIDYYNQALDGGSPDPADSSVTVRVLTIMLALEY